MWLLTVTLMRGSLQHQIVWTKADYRPYLKEKHINASALKINASSIFSLVTFIIIITVSFRKSKATYHLALKQANDVNLSHSLFKVILFVSLCHLSSLCLLSSVYVSAVQPLLSQSLSAAGPLLPAAPPAGAT